MFNSTDSRPRAEALDLDKEALANRSYRKVYRTYGDTMQIVLMCVAGTSGIAAGGGCRPRTFRPREDIPSETHPGTVQTIRVVEGEMRVCVSDIKKTPSGYLCGTITRTGVGAGGTFVVPPGFEHKVVVSSQSPLHLVVTYSPPEHPPELEQVAQPVSTGGPGEEVPHAHHEAIEK